jgi:predicted Zn-dependent protease
MVPTSAGPFEMELTFIAYEGQVYRLSAGARQGKFQRYAGVFRGFARSFRSLRKDESALIDEVRLRLVRVREDEDLAVLSERTGNTWDLNRTAIMNGLTIGDDLEVGLLIKVAIREAYVPPPAPVSVEPEPSGSESTGDSQVSPPEPVSSEDAG